MGDVSVETQVEGLVTERKPRTHSDPLLGDLCNALHGLKRPRTRSRTKARSPARPAPLSPLPWVCQRVAGTGPEARPVRRQHRLKPGPEVKGHLTYTPTPALPASAPVTDPRVAAIDVQPRKRLHADGRERERESGACSATCGRRRVCRPASSATCGRRRVCRAAPPAATSQRPPAAGNGSDVTAPTRGREWERRHSAHS